MHSRWVRAARSVLFSVGVLWAVQVAAQTKAIPQRSDIAPEYKWRLEDIYATTEAWQADFDKVKAELPKLTAMKGTLGSSGDALLAALKLNDEIGDIADRLYVYANMKLDEDSRVSDYQVLADKASLIYTEVGSAASFIEPEVVSIPEAKLWEMVSSTPDLEVYRHHLENMVRTAAHTLSEPEEKLLAEARQVTRGPSNIYNMLETADMDYGTIVDEEGDSVALTLERYYKLRQSTDRRVRRDVSFAFDGAFEDLQNTLAAAYSASVKGDIFYAKARKYESTLEMRLDANNIPEAVYENLITAVNNNLGPYHRYNAFRQKVLGLDTLHAYDTYVPLVPEAEIEFTWEEAKKEVVKGLKKLGKQYIADLEKGLSSGWIDVYETQGKASGAYNWGSYSTHPYVLMNFNGTLENMFTLGHEMGHAMHGYYSHNNQPYIYGYNPTFTAEVASTTNEALIMNQLLKDTKDPEQKKYLLDYYIDQITGTFYTQVMFSEFEHTVHQKMESGEPISTEGFRKLYRDIYQRYIGPDVVIDSSKDMTWARISHFYRSYYVYQYATSYSAGLYIARRIIDGDTELRDKYLEFLKKGSSEYPVDELKEMGVDLTTPGPAEAVAKQFNDLVKQLEELMLKS